MTTPHARSGFPLLAGSAIALGLAACGGGGSGGSTGTSTAAITIKGTAITDAPIANANVDAKCASGSGSAQTSASGAFQINLTNAALPCVLSVPDGTGALYSVVETGAGSSPTANLTPLTDALVASLAGTPPATLYTTFNAAAQARITAAGVATARTNLAAALSSVTDISALDPLKDDLVTSPAATAIALGKLSTALTDARLLQSELATALAIAGSITAPVKTILQAASPTCSGLRSGTYRLITPFNGSGSAFERITIDAQNLIVRYEDGSTDAMTDHGGCLFSQPDNTQVHVAASGISMWRYPASSSTTAIALAVPEQTLPLAAMTGTWNNIGFARETAAAGLEVYSTQYTLDGSGVFSNALDCGSGLGDTCSTNTPLSTLVANPQGGFDTSQGGVALRAFPFRTASGETTLIVATEDRSMLSVSALATPLSLPAIGSITRYWNASIGSTGLQTSFIAESTTITAQDANAGTYSRSHASNGHAETITINKPKPGMRYRPASVASTTGGGTVNVSEALLMRAGDSGLSVGRSVASGQNFLALSIDRP